MEQTWPTDERQGQTTRELSVPLWLTRERALYGLMVAVGLAVRLAALGRWPLLEEEAETALAAWRTLQGSTWRPEYYSPLLYGANLFCFALLQATDAAVRLLPALVGALLPLSLYALRERVGRHGALAAAALLTLAPTWVFFSRTAATPILATGSSLLLLAAGLRYVATREERFLTLGAVALALGLASGPGIYTLLVAATLFGGGQLLAARRGQNKLGRTGQPPLYTAITRRHGLLLVGTFLAIASALGFNLGGIGASADLAGWWVRDLFSTSDLPATAVPRILVTYESLTLVLALIGAVQGLRRKDDLTAFFGIWLLVALATSILGGHRTPMWSVDALLPLVLLAALGAQTLCQELSIGATPYEWAAVAVALAVSAFGFLKVATYTHTGQSDALTYARVAWGLLIIAWAAYWYWRGVQPALLVATIVLGAAFGVLTVRATTAVAYQTARDAREPLAQWPTSQQMSAFREWIITYSSRRAGDPHALDVAYVEDLDPWIGWYLRDFWTVEAIPGLPLATGQTALIAPAREEDKPPPGYVGQRFRLREGWAAQRLSPRERLRWLFYRDPVGHEIAEEFEIWVRLSSAE